MKQLLKRLLFRIAPESAAAIMAARARAHSHRVVAGWGGGAVASKLRGRFGDAVQEGPFQGLTLTPMCFAEQIGPYLLGVYESELDGAWATVFRGAYAQIIDIGAKFGFYAVGLAKRYPAASVVVFDTDVWARRAIREMAAANDTPAIEVKGFCRPRWLAEHVVDGALVVSDCEGYEGELFQPAVVGRLRSATLIVETHDDVVPGVSDRLLSLFQTTHDVRVVSTGTRRRFSGDLGFLTPRERELAEQEVRPPQVWLLCLPRVGPNATIGSA